LPTPVNLPITAGMLELKSDPHPPDPLTMADGSPVKTPEQWFERRAPELRAMFERYMYGFFPPAPDEIEPTVLPGEHSMGHEDWTVLLDYADRWL